MFLNSCLRKRSRNKLRSINRGYRIIRKTKGASYLASVRNDIVATELKRFRPFVKGCIEFDQELSARQFLYERLLGIRFNKEFLFALGSGRPMRYPLPKEWRDKLREFVDVDEMSCVILWYMAALFYWFKGVKYAFKEAHIKGLPRSNRDSYSVFFKVPNPKNFERISSNNVFTWYLKWKGKGSKVDFLTVDSDSASQNEYSILGNEVIYTSFFPKLTSSNFIVFYLKMLQEAFVALLFLTAGNPFKGFFLEELVKLHRMRCSNNSSFAVDYLFNNSNMIYRPIWTYFPEQHAKSRVLFYFYSTNNIPVEQKGENHPIIHTPFFLNTWSHYLVWDKFQEEFVRELTINDPEIEVVGPISFLWEECEAIKTNRYVSVFDIVPLRRSIYQLYGEQVEYLVPEVVNKFLLDIYRVCKKNNITMVHKGKKSLDCHLRWNKSYLGILNWLKSRENYIYIENSCDVETLIGHSLASISFPYTSTAHIAHGKHIPAMYYDPTDAIQGGDVATHGVPVLGGVNELGDWVKSLKSDHTDRE